MQNFVLQIGQENLVGPGNSDIIIWIPVKTHAIPTKDDLGCLVLYDLWLAVHLGTVVPSFD